MKKEKWAEYEAKQKELKKQCKKACLIIWLIWAVVIAVLLTAIILLYKTIGIEVAVILAVLSFGFSVLVALNKTGVYIRTNKQQSVLLEQDEPFGRFNT